MPQYGTSEWEVVWGGRGPLTAWPDRDWAHILGTPGFDLIWDRPPRTSSWRLERYARLFGASLILEPSAPKPSYGNKDHERRLEDAWSQLVEVRGGSQGSFQRPQR